MNVKKFIAITTICAAMLCTGTYITASADTAAGISIPDSFTVEITDALTSVNDYAVGDNQFAFADGKTIYIYSADETKSSGYDYFGELTTYTHSSSVTTLEYSDGKLYFYDGASTYLYSNGSATAADFTFTTVDDNETKTDGNFWYYFIGGNFVVYNYTNLDATSYSDATYKKLKYIDSCYYVLKDNTLCTISDGVLSEISFSYDDYNDIKAIATNDTAEALSETTTVRTAKVAEGACIIRVDEDYLDETSFTILKVDFAEKDMTAQVLYSPDGGNAALIAVGTKTYLTLKTNLTVSAYSLSETAAGSYYLLDSASVYSIPYENEYTKVAEIDKDAVVTVTGCVSGDMFDYDYYKVEYTADGKTVSGYVVSGLMTTYTFANDNLEENVLNDGDQSYDNNNFTIALVMVIVVLVLIAAGYVTFVATSDKKKKNRRHKDFE